MNRQIVYPGAIPLETDLLNTNKYSMLGLAKLASSLMGGNTYVHGLACTPSSPASMVVNVAAGQIYSLQNIDGTAYSSLPADTTHSILKQGYVLDAQQFTLTAPSTSGYSINYLIQVTYSDVDGGSTVLPYYNASNPSVAWSGPNNSGSAQFTVRQGMCIVSLKAGVAATTGKQITPSPDTGCTGLYVITVAQGATSVTAGNIAVYANAPFLPQGGIVDGIQKNSLRYAVDTGTSNAYVVNINPGILSLSDGMEVNFKAANANTTSSTLNVCSLGAYPVLNKFGQTLISGEIASGSHVTVKWSASASSWLILNSTNAIPTVPTAAPGTSTTQEASTAFVLNSVNTLSLSRSNPFGDINADGTVNTAKINLGIQAFNSSGSATTVSAPTSGVFLYVADSGNWGVQDSVGNPLPLPIAGGGTGANTLLGARVNLGVSSFGSDSNRSTVTAPNSAAYTFITNYGDWGASGSSGQIIPLAVSRGGTGDTSAAGARTNLGLKTAATRDVGVGSGQIPDMGSFQFSAVAKGYEKLPSGEIRQWGTISIPAANASTDFAFDTFAIPFPNGVLNCRANGTATTTNTPCFATAEAISTTQIRLKAIAIDLSNKTITQGMAVTVAWEAIGA